MYKQARKYYQCHEKLAQAREQLQFNLRCKRNNIIPKSLRMRPPIQSHEAIEYFRSTVSKRCLTFFIDDDHRRINQINFEIRAIDRTLSTHGALDEEIISDLRSASVNRLYAIRSKEKERLQLKYEHLS